VWSEIATAKRETAIVEDRGWGPTLLLCLAILLAAVTVLAAEAASGTPPPVPYDQDPRTGDYWPRTNRPGWSDHDRDSSISCARG